MRTLIACILLTVCTLFGQSKTYFDAPFAIGVGYTPAWMIPDLKGINTNVKAFGTPELSTSGFYAGGIAGYVYLGFIPGLRVGGMGISGSTIEKSTSGGISREVAYNSGFGGFTVEYTLPFFRKFAASVGMVLGGGTSDLTVSRHNAGSYAWDDIWGELSDPAKKTENYTRTIKHSYFSITPTVNVDVPLYRFISVRLGAGYTIPFGDDWKMDNDVSVTNIPDDVKSGGLYISSGIFIGFFSF